VRLISELLEAQAGEAAAVTLRDQGRYYQLELSPPLDMALVEGRRTPLMPISMIRTLKNADGLPADLLEAHVVDYEAQRERTNLYFAAVRQRMPEDSRPPRPHQHWDIFRAINPGTLPGYNALVEAWWAIRDHQAAVLRLLFNLFSNTPNDLTAAVSAWKQLDKANGWGIGVEATCAQLYNPDQGKGQNRVKPDGVSMGNLGQFWLLEWLKAVGFYEAALTRQVRGAKDRKTFVVTPRELAFSESRKIMSDFMDTMQVAETATKLDILAALRYTQALLQYFLSDPSRMEQLLRRKNIKRNVVAGFQTAFYKDLGNAVATLNLAFIALPGWVEVDSRDDLALYTDPETGLLTELEKVARQFDETHSDAFTLLQHLRNFVSGDDLTAFFRFTDAYPAYLMGMRERNKYAYQMTTTFVERLIMSTESGLSRILESEGFQNIAYAIRQSTVTAQYRKKQGDRKYDVRYGLGQELSRKARYPDQFISALSDFLHKYNAENAQVMETRSGPYRRSVKTGDIDDIVALIDEFGSETVANLLIAYGYARTHREDSQDSDDVQPAETDQEIEA
jgi:hypothetical protein